MNWQDLVIQNAKFAIIATDNNGVINSFNRAAESMLQYSQEEVIGKLTPLSFHLPSEIIALAKKQGIDTSLDIEEIRRQVTEKVLEHWGSDGEFTYVRKDQTLFPVRLTCCKITNEEGKVVGYMGIAEDISSLRQVKTELDQMYGAIDRSAIVVVTDKVGKIIDVNENFCTISGYLREELLGKDHRIINSGHHSKDFFKNLWTTISKGEVWQGEIKNKKKNGDFYWVQTVISPLYDSSNKLDRYIAIRFDITERKTAENNLLQSAKMATLGEMAGNMAHEINNPLSIILGRSKQLQRGLTGFEVMNTDEVVEGLKKIDQTCHRIGKIVRGLRNFARNSDDDPLEAVKVSKFIEESLELCAEKIKNHSIDLQLKVDGDFTFYCRLSQMLQVVMNLISNSFDAIVDQPEKWIRIEVSASEGKVLIAVVDSGAGILKEISDKILEPFFTTKPVGKGTGLGLSISKGLVESHGGRLYLDPRSENTKFVIEIPSNLAQQ